MKNKLIVLTVAVATVAGIASAGNITTPHVVGDYNGWANPDASAAMTETALGSDIWTYDISGLTSEQYQQFKVVNGDGSWSTTTPSANSWYSADGSGDVTITYDGNTYSDGWLPVADRVGVSTEPGAWSAVGDFNGWNNADPALAMTPLGGGIYSVTSVIADGNYTGKAVATGSWDGIGGDSRSIDAWNIDFTTGGGQNEVIFTVDAYAGTAKIEVVPEPATLGLLGMAGVGMFLVRRKLKI